MLETETWETIDEMTGLPDTEEHFNGVGGLGYPAITVGASSEGNRKAIFEQHTLACRSIVSPVAHTGVLHNRDIDQDEHSRRNFDSRVIYLTFCLGFSCCLT